MDAALMTIIALKTQIWVFRAPVRWCPTLHGRGRRRAIAASRLVGGLALTHVRPGTADSLRVGGGAAPMSSAA